MRILIATLLGLAFALPAAADRIVGELGADHPRGIFRMTFTCSFPSGRTGTCEGLYHDTESIFGCNNMLQVSHGMSISGWNLSAPGNISGTLILRGAASDVVNVGGNCSIAPNPGDATVTATGIFDGTKGVFSFQTNDTPPVTVSGTFKVETESVKFLLENLAGSFNPTGSSNASVGLRPHSSDAGTEQSVFVFFYAPASKVGGATSMLKTDPASCVLAQVNAQGQLISASASSLSAAYTGVLNAAGTTITLLNNVPTANVAGATIFVGYGPSSSTMIGNDKNRAVVTVPGGSGTSECKAGGPQTGWWWNTNEGGRGYSIERQGNNLFMAAYFYEADGRATWLVASGPTTFEGALFTAPLYRCTGGVTLAGPYRANNCATAGNVSLLFNSATTGTMIWPGGTVGIERFNIIGGGLAWPPMPNQPESGWWWSTAEDGRGYFIEWQGGTADIAGYMYDDAGNPVWFITVIPVQNILSMTGAWWRFADGMTQAGPYKPATRTSDNVGPLSITFSSGTTATLTLPGGRQVALTRFRF